MTDSIVEDESLVVAPTMMQLIKTWNHSEKHPHGYRCPTCGGNTNIAVDKIAYTFTVCRCDVVEYDHLVEVIYHRTCLEPTACGTFYPWPQRSKNGIRREPPDECRVCGRPKAAH